MLSGIYKLAVAVNVEVPVAVAVPADVAFRTENCHLLTPLPNCRW